MRFSEALDSAASEVEVTEQLSVREEEEEVLLIRIMKILLRVCLVAWAVVVSNILRCLKKVRMSNTTCRQHWKNLYLAQKKKLSLRIENRNEEINVKIPAGISTGKKLRLPGKAWRGTTAAPTVIYI